MDRGGVPRAQPPPPVVRLVQKPPSAASVLGGGLFRVPQPRGVNIADDGRDGREDAPGEREVIGRRQGAAVCTCVKNSERDVGQ